MSARKKKRRPKQPATVARAPKPSAVQPVPFGWLVSKWTEIAPGVPPGSTSAGKHLVRVRRDELVACGALVRVGRELTVLGSPYIRWLQSEAHRKAVKNFEIAANREAQS
jgi:hypothetical protein